MKILLISSLFLISFSALAAKGSSGPSKKSGTFSVLYGLGNYVEGSKTAEDLKPTGNAVKLLFGERNGYFDANLMLHYAGLTDTFTDNGTKGRVKHHSLGYGAQFGFWPFNWMNLHVGFANHAINERIYGSFTAAEKETLDGKYHLKGQTTPGLFGGGEIVLLQNQSFQLFANYDYYHLNGLRAHYWETLAGVRVYWDKKAGGTEKNFVFKLFEKMFSPSSGK